MILDLRDPEAVRAWLAIRPEQHRATLKALWALFPRLRQDFKDATPAKPASFDPSMAR